MAPLSAHPVDVSIVVPAFNAAAHLPDQLAALLDQQTDLHLEIVVVDNGSSDHTRSVVLSAMERTDRVRLVDASKVRGSSYARNEGVKAALGRVVAFCDADDIVEDGWIEALVRAAAPGLIVTGPLIVDAINDADVSRWRPPRDGPALNPAFGFLPFAPSGNFAMLRSDYLRLGGFNEAYPKSHDVEFSWRAQLAGMRLVYVEGARLHYRYRATLRGVLRQAVRSGRASAQLYADFRAHGLRAATTPEALRAWGWLVARAPLLMRPVGRGTWVRRFGEALGRLSGSIRHRVLYL
jgi:glycosyltransferase involved in cell wall biosynthesis